MSDNKQIVEVMSNEALKALLEETFTIMLPPENAKWTEFAVISRELSRKNKEKLVKLAKSLDSYQHQCKPKKA